jgi:diadenosine tetraphosphate (Ap4A) HIT family hydrolase
MLFLSFLMIKLDISFNTSIMTSHKPCPFCTLPTERIIDSNEFGVVIRDGYPISEGHTLIIPKRHVGSFFETTQEEKLALLALLESTQKQLKKEFNPPSFNIGINDGKEAGQTVPHLHIHLIPRYELDMTDPRGGVRWIIPEKAKYWQ